MSSLMVEQANELNLAGRYDEALELYDQLLTQNHDHPELLSTVGTILLRNRRFVGLATVVFRLALEKGMKAPELYANLGLAYKFSGQYDKAIKFMGKAVEKEPSAGTLTNFGSMFIENDNPEEGQQYLERAIKMDPSCFLAHWNLSLLLLETGQWERAWDEYEYGGDPKGMRPERALADKPKWDGSPGQTVVVSGEQGIGDEIMFASMLPELMQTNKVVFECHPRLKTLFERSFGLKCYPTRKEKEVMWCMAEEFDARINLGSLGKFYRRSRDKFPGTPYLKADPLPRGNKFRVGISWTGGRFSDRVAKRTVPLGWWQSILNVPDVEFVSLQYTEGSEEEIATVEAQGFTVSQPPEAKADDYYETARLVASCDLVISVCTSIVHLSGALGVPCWVMVPKHPAWRYQRTGGMPWYKSVRLYRQPSHDGDSWLPVIQTVGADLAEVMERRAQKVA